MQEDNAKTLTMEDCEYDAGIREEKQGNTGMQEWEMCIRDRILTMSS